MAASVFRIFVLYITTIAIGAQMQAIISSNEDNSFEIQFSIEPNDIVVARGKPAILHCMIKDEFRHEDLRIKWTVNGTEIISNDRRKYIHENGSLIFRKVRRRDRLTDEGVYQCIASVRTTILLSRPAVLKIAELSNVFRFSPDYQRAHLGDNVRISCSLKSVPPADIVWFFRNSSLQLNNSRYDTTFVSSGVLYIFDLQMSDFGEYRCVGTNPLTKKSRSSNAFKLILKNSGYYSQRDPQWISPSLPKSMDILQNKQLNLECAVSHRYSNGGIVWLYQKYDYSQRVIIGESKETHYTLNIREMRLNDSGYYTCSVYFLSIMKEIMSLNQTVEVRVVAPPVITQKSRSRILPISLKCKFLCEFSGHPKPTVVWIHNGKQLVETDRIVITENEMTLTSTVAQDTGMYQCMVRNAYGVASAAVHLTITGSAHLPQPPQSLTCGAVNSSQIYISWELSDDDGREPPPPVLVHNPKFGLPDTLSDDLSDGFSVGGMRTVVSGVHTVHYYPSDDPKLEKEIVTLEKSIIIGDLTPDKDYTVYVKTYNRKSASLQSDKKTCRTLANEMLLPLKFVILSSTAVYVAWPKSRTTIVSRYKVIWKVSNVNEVNTAFTNSTSYIISGLDQTSYEIIVFPITSNGQMLSEYESQNFSNPADPTVLEMSPLNSTTVQIFWNLKHISLQINRLIVLYRWKDDTTYIIEADPYSNTLILFNLASGKDYDVSLKVLMPGAEGVIAQSSISTPNDERSLDTYDKTINIWAEAISSCSVRVSWMAPIGYTVIKYMVSYGLLTDGFQHSISLNGSVSKIVIDDLLPYTVYKIKVSAFDNDQEINESEIKEVRTLFQAPAVISDTTWTQVNSTAVRIQWKEPHSLTGLVKQYIVSYTSQTDGSVNTWPKINVSHDKHSLEIADLKTDVNYNYVIRASTESGTSPAGNPTAFVLRTDEELFMNQKLIDPIINGILIGLCGGAVCILALIIVLCYGCKKYKDHVRNCKLSSQRDAYIGNTEELRLRSANSTEYKYFDSENGKTAEEIHNLLCLESPANETCLTMVEINERDGEAGDSGFCDKNTSSNSSNSNGSRRKCSDAMPDDGFYETECNGQPDHVDKRYGASVT